MAGFLFQIQTLGDSIRAGDVLLSNHPKAGGSHLPDLTVITPVSARSDYRMETGFPSKIVFHENSLKTGMKWYSESWNQESWFLPQFACHLLFHSYQSHK